MDLKDSIKQLSDRIEKVKNNLQTEEATKTALIMPFLQVLGYDVFDPLEVVPEYTCDIGTKKGEKIDYAILKEERPIILIECKHWKQDLNLHDNQLLRYFHVSKAKFGILTNGIVYRFYTDLETPNKMDEKPFLEIDITDVRSGQIDELKKFHKAYFNVENILSSANDLKYTSELKILLCSEFSSPGADFVKMFAKQVYSGRMTDSVIEQFAQLIKRSIASLINEAISDRLKSALKTETEESEKAESDLQSEITNDKKEDKIITTPEEIEAFYIIKSIIRKHISVDRITFRDAQSYFSVIIDDNNRKPVCRLYLSTGNKVIAFIGEDKKEIREKITSIDDLFLFSDQLSETVKKYV